MYVCVSVCVLVRVRVCVDLCVQNKIDVSTSKKKDAAREVVCLCDNVRVWVFVVYDSSIRMR